MFGMVNTKVRDQVRNLVILSALAVPAIALTAPAAIAGKDDFHIVNETNAVIQELYLSDSRRDSWDNDILGRDILRSGQSVQVEFGDMSSNACLYDIRAVFADGEVVEDYRINVCTNDYYRFFDK